MPYITRKYRESLERLYQSFSSHSLKPAEINYLLFRFCLENIEPSYENYAKFIGMLETCKLEIYRRQVATHENKKIRENGDIEV